MKTERDEQLRIVVPFGDDVRREERVPDRVETFLDGSGEDFPWHDRQDGVSRWGSLRRVQGDAFE